MAEQDPLKITAPGSNPGSATFNCTSCGLCCRIDLSDDLPKDWDRGDGYCKNLQEDMRCGVYETRPLVCRIDESWDKDQPRVIQITGAQTREEFHETLYRQCSVLQEAAKP